MAARRTLLTMIAGALAILLLAACGDASGSTPTATPLPGTWLEPPRDLPDVALTRENGDAAQLGDLRGKVTLVFFGYTHCPDVCPLTLSEFKQVKAALGEQASQAAFVFVTVDPARDTPERLATYLGAFDPAFIGLAGDDAATAEIAQAFGVFYQRADPGGSAADYTVDHTASLFVLDRASRLRVVYSSDTDPAILAQGMIRVLGEGA